MSKIYYDELLFDAVQRLGLTEDSNAFGIAMQVVYWGYWSLSPVQTLIWEMEVLPLLVAQDEQDTIGWGYVP
jgi:hypothetical protein